MKYIILMLLISVASLSATETETVNKKALSKDPVSLEKITKKLPKITVGNWSPKLHQQLVQVFAANHEWAALNTALEDWLIANYSYNVVAKDGWKAMAGLQQWCYLFAKNPRIYTSLKPETVAWLLSDRLLTETLFTTLKPQDDKQAVVGLLQDFYQKYPKTFPEYDRLAVAVAVVWEKPRSFRPHSQVPQSSVLTSFCTATDRYDFWVKTQAGGYSDCNLTELDPKFSKFIVDANCTIEELRWAQTRTHFTRGRLGKAYSSIKYDHDRLKNEVYSWPHGTYSLKEIKRKGGICIDQAYFAIMAGKASGIPTLYFSGSGRGGFHAWFGYMKDKDSWDLDCGRYATQNYVAGNATDPQTGLSLSDHQLAYITKANNNTQASKNSDARVKAIGLLLRRGQKKEALEAINKSVKDNSKHLASWKLKTEVLESSKDKYPLLKSHLEEMQSQFKDYAEIKLEAQLKLEKAARTNNDLETAKSTMKSAIDDTRRDRHDLSLKLYRDNIKIFTGRNEWEEAGKLHREAVTKFKKEVSAVYSLTDFFVNICLNNNRISEAKRAVKHLKSRVDYKESVQLESLIKNLEKRIKDKIKSKK